MKTFKSDNTASVHPSIMTALMRVNEDHATPYGDDPITHKAEKMIRNLFGGDCQVTFVLNGTGANVVGLSSLIGSHHGVICCDTAHINVDECGAFERLTGAKLITVPHQNGKLTVEAVLPLLEALGNEHHNQPKVISISQITEWGTIYSLEEIRKLADFAHDHRLFLHVDGARIANAAVALGVSFKEMITDTGVDILSFGGAKNGMMYGEAIVSFHRKSSGDLKYIRKQSMQLMSKMRYIAAQYIGLLDGELWHENALNANRTMEVLYNGIKDLKGVDFMDVPMGNMAFVTMPSPMVEALLHDFYFYVMSTADQRTTVRLVTSFDTLMEEVTDFVEVAREIAVQS